MMDYSKKEYTDGKGYNRHGSPEFYKLLEEMADTHDSKSHDYATNDNPYGNYRFAGLVANLFSHSPDDAGFAGRLAEKLYRISVLEGGGKTPKNESIADTERDIAVITSLWMASRREKRKSSQYDVGERYPGPPNAMGCNEQGVKLNETDPIPAAYSTPGRIGSAYFKVVGILNSMNQIEKEELYDLLKQMLSYKDTR